ncbi:MAG: TetR/AcrR family transcriptional regulator [Solirubrobacteraceae bacterium]|nr:TetR/AcrR family transcriptional regulator [Solirubrobacteraceae bacterium]MDP4672560.1 TetR/AcrR family transcriptional regulator [Solirubrobacteraceae bacterium]MDP4921764.1 TetR/AcrR family transcriptional regulator [Solirubrobacteraceae bacterium]
MAVAKAQRASRSDPEARRDQMIDVALVAFADRGYPGVELKEIASEVGVTPNLIHHYFPGGKSELHLEAVKRACAQLAEIHDSSAEATVGDKMPTNISRYLDEALVPTDRWKLYTRSLRSADDDLRAYAIATRQAVVEGMALNHLGIANPPPAVRALFFGLFGFLEDAAEEWRIESIGDREKLENLIMTVILAGLAATAAE